MVKSGKKVVIFGIEQIAEVAWYYFTHDSEYTPVAFTVDRQYKNKDHFQSLPVIAFEEIQASFPPEECDIFVAVGYSKFNSIRSEKLAHAIAFGYKPASYINSRVTIYPGVKIGKHAFIMEDNTIQPFVTIGDDVTLWSGNHIGHHTTIGDHCFLASHIVVSGGVVIGERCFIGVNATFRDHITVGSRCIIGAGALIMSDAEAGSVYKPAPTECSKKHA